jgi:uncharacterized 2Fe-2S/4Fe-4S cluster protein (DUF4445 family)
MLTDRPEQIALVFDLGTTSLAGRVLNSTGQVVAEAQVANPQREAGADILQRLQLAHEGYGGRLQELLLAGLVALVDQLLDQSGSCRADIARAAAAGNPGMSCLLRNLPVSSLLFPPHKPPYKGLICLPVSEADLGLQVPLELFPLVSGFVGGDLVACLFALEDVQPGTLLIDVGTNAELALWDGLRWWATSAAAGPAFEGGNITAGMIMADGVVTDFRLDGDRLRLIVAGGSHPRGLCGSGLASLVAVARQGGLIDASGRILSPDEVETNLGRYLVEKDGSWAIRFHHNASTELLLTQADLRNFQLAKGAVLAGAQVLLERSGYAPEDVSQLFVTGALGTALPKDVLKRVALLPEPMLDKTSFVANGVLAGLQSYLNATDGQQQLADLISTIQPFPLSGTPAFEKLFLSALEF